MDIFSTSKGLEDTVKKVMLGEGAGGITKTKLETEDNTDKEEVGDKSGFDKELYREIFKKKLKEYKVGDPTEIEETKVRKEFFKSVDEEYETKHKADMEEKAKKEEAEAKAEEADDEKKEETEKEPKEKKEVKESFSNNLSKVRITGDLTQKELLNKIKTAVQMNKGKIIGKHSKEMIIGFTNKKDIDGFYEWTRIFINSIKQQLKVVKEHIESYDECTGGGDTPSSAIHYNLEDVPGSHPVFERLVQVVHDGDYRLGNKVVKESLSLMDTISTMYLTESLDNKKAKEIRDIVMGRSKHRFGPDQWKQMIAAINNVVGKRLNDAEASKVVDTAFTMGEEVEKTEEGCDDETKKESFRHSRMGDEDDIYGQMEDILQALDKIEKKKSTLTPNQRRELEKSQAAIRALKKSSN